jgi:hypothetical protein
VKRAIHNFSVSQVETFGMDQVEIFGEPGEPGCPRKHFFSWILGKKPPATDAQQRGTYVHESIAKFITEKTSPPTEHAIYLRALEPYFPEGDYSVEHKLTLDTHVGIPWIGFIDLICEDSGQTTLVDWKTTSDLRYAKTPDELRRNLQLNVYAHYAYELGVENDVNAGLVYVEVPKTPPKRQAKVLPVFIDISRQQAAHVWDATKPVLDQMLEVSQLDDPQDVPCNTAICGKYGGCPFRTECGISMFSGVSTSGSHTPAKNKELSMSTPSFLDKLKNKNGQTSAPPPQAVSAPPPVVQQPQVVSEAPSGNRFLNRNKTAAATEPAEVKTEAAPFSIIPPDAPPRDSGGADPLPEGVVGIGPVVINQPAQVEAPKRGRPRGSKNSAETAPAAEVKGAPATSTRREFVLYIDCMVVKGRGVVEPTDLSDWFGPIEMELNELAAGEDQPHWMLLGFGPQKAALALKVQEQISKGLPPSMLVSSSSPMAREVLPMLLPHASVVVRALRG